MKNELHHVAILAHGYHKWADLNLSTIRESYSEGWQVTVRIACYVRKFYPEIQTLTFFPFSQSDWQEGSGEKNNPLLESVHDFLKKDAETLLEEGIKLKFSGLYPWSTPDTERDIERLEWSSVMNSDLTVQLALAPNGRSSIIRAVKGLVLGVIRGRLNPDDITEASLGSQIESASFPETDLILMTGGQQGLGNCLVWEGSYSELHISQKLWPSFCPLDFDEATEDYFSRQRRKGLTPEQIASTNT